MTNGILLSMPKWFKIATALTSIILVAGVVAAGYIAQQFQPVSSTPQAKQRFVIPKGQALQTIADHLADEGFIRQPLVFRYEVKRLGLGTKIQAGSFEISSSMTPGEIAKALTVGTNDIWITIPEGWRREEIAESLERQELESFDKDDFLELSASSEGKLFPDTYLVPRQASAEYVFNLLTSTFDQKVVEGLADEIKRSGRDFDQMLIMASLVEREANGFDQMKGVAGVLWHRVDIGMKLDIDATLQYAKGYSLTEDKWWVTPLAVDRQIDSPFNTYRNPGLPPRPIANPGLDAIRAALQPTKTTNLFYLHDSEGRVHFAQTLDEHNRNIERYLR